jgi:hydroxypyruvate reductase
MEILRKMRRDAIELFRIGLRAVDPLKVIKKSLRIEGSNLILKTPEGDRVFNLDRFKNIYLVGTGKASTLMARAVEEILNGRIKEGVITTKYEHSHPLKYTEIIEAGHPIPDMNSLRGAKKIMEIVSKAGEEDLIIFVISGGGSSLMVCPFPEISLDDKRKITDILLKSGASIREINAVRKHLSLVKGGRLAKLAFPATVISLILSDVVGDRLDTIASGPFVPDETTFRDAHGILKKYELEDRIPTSIKTHILKGVAGEVEETPKPGERYFERIFNVIVGSNIIALEAVKRKAREMGYNTLLLSSLIEGETNSVASVHTAIAKEILKTGNPVSPPACIISGGETTVVVRGKGKGGRNQEFVLRSAMDIENENYMVILSGGTDGTDGPTDAAGAIADSQTVKRAKEKGIDPEKYLENNDSYNFFKKLDDLLITGPTGTNVMDLRIILVADKEKHL